MITESLSVIVDKTTRRKTKSKKGTFLLSFKYDLSLLGQKDWPIHSIFIEKTIEKPIFDM